MRDPLYHPTPVTAPRVFVVRMVVFLAVVACVIVLIWPPLWLTFLANPLLNGLILFILLTGLILAAIQVLRLFPEVRWVNGFGSSSISTKRGATSEIRLLAPMAKLLGDDNAERMISPSTMRSILDAIGMRLDESREIVRYLTGLLIFLGLLGTFWGLTQTIRSVGTTIAQLDSGATDLSIAFGTLKQGLAAPLEGMSTAFASSLFGLGGSLVLGFMGLQANQAQGRFFNQLEDWLAGQTAISAEMGGLSGRDMKGFASTDSEIVVAALERLDRAINESRNPSSLTQSMDEVSSNLIELGRQFKQDHALLQTWVRSQINEQSDMRRFLEALVNRQNFPPRGHG